MNCQICFSDKKDFELMSFGCCAFKCCQECYLNLKDVKCPLCRKEIIIKINDKDTALLKTRVSKQEFRIVQLENQIMNYQTELNYYKTQSNQEIKNKYNQLVDEYNNLMMEYEELEKENDQLESLVINKTITNKKLKKHIQKNII